MSDNKANEMSTMDLAREFRDESAKLAESVTDNNTQSANGEKLYSHRNTSKYGEGIYKQDQIIASALGKSSADFLCDALNAYSSEVKRVKKVNRGLVKALEFYENEHNHRVQDKHIMPAIVHDCGKIARTALSLASDNVNLKEKSDE